MKMETLSDVMNRLSWLKNSGETTPFGDSADEREIKSIDSILRIFGVKWHYELYGNRWFATIDRQGRGA